MQKTHLIKQLQSSISLLSMMPPSRIKKNILGLINISPDIEDYLYDKVQLPLDINTSGSQAFLYTELNRDGDNYRSPCDNKYYPEMEKDAYIPSTEFRRFEEMGNLLFSEYTKLYYGKDGLGSFYVLENQSDLNRFSCGYFAKKVCPLDTNQNGFQGEWNSFNIVDIEIKPTLAIYTLNSTVMLEMTISKQSNSNMNLNGFQKSIKTIQKPIIKIKQQDMMQHHLITVGEMVQELQTQMRQKMQAVYVAKTKQIVFTTRYEDTRQTEMNKYRLAQQLKSVRLSKQ